MAFSKDWRPTAMEVTKRDREKIRTGVAKGFREVFTKQLQEEGGYQVVDSAGPDVLRVTAGIIELYIEAPDTARTSGISRSWVVSAGNMTLVGELRERTARVARGGGPTRVVAMADAPYSLALAEDAVYWTEYDGLAGRQTAGRVY